MAFEYTKKYVFKYLRDIEEFLDNLNETIDKMKPKRLKEVVKDDLESIRNRVSGIEVWLRKDLKELEEIDSDDFTQDSED